MKNTVPLSLGAACLLFALATGSIAYLGSFSFANTDSWRNDTLNEFAAQPADSEATEPSSGDIESRIRQKQEVAKALIVGDLSFGHAAERLRLLSGNEMSDRMRAMYPGATDSELWHRQVIAFVQGLGRDYPERVAVLVPELQNEVARRFQSNPAYVFAGNRATSATPAGRIGYPATSP
jgi:hypothetical protein